jgi:RNA polymerase sigma-70 factor (ECF subfamily)
MMAPVSPTTPAGNAPPDQVAPRSDFREIFEANVHFVWRSLMGLGVRENDIPDASQQVFVILAKKLDQLDPGCALRTFVYGVCLRVAADFRKRAHVRREHLYGRLPERPTAAEQEGLVSQREALERLRTALDLIDPGQREVFVLYEIEELGMAEVARAVGCPLQTAYSRLHAARRRIAAVLGEHGEDL